MSYSGIQMLMEKLNQLIRCNDASFINNNPEIIPERPQFQLLYHDLNSIIQTLGFIEDHHLETLNNLRRRFRDAAEEAEYIVDLFLSSVHIRNARHLLNLDDDDDDTRKSYRIRNRNRNNGHLLTSGDSQHPSTRSFKYVIGRFLSCVNIGKNRNLPTPDDINLDDGGISPSSVEVGVGFSTSDDDLNPSPNLDDVRRSFKTVQGEFPTSEDFDFSLNLHLDDVRRSFKSLRLELMNGMDMDLSQRPENQSAPPQYSISTTSPGPKKLLTETVVGLDSDLELIKDKLAADYPKKLDVVSIVGMGGIGKTTLATKVFNDPFVVYHFHVRVWVTVSQTYDKRDALIQILASIGVKERFEKASDSRLREMVHKSLMGRRYLIVIDDIWDIEAWDNVKLFFPHDNMGSRIMLTSRLTEVAKHANSDGFIHHLGYLNKERSWELLREKVFHGNEYPKWSIQPGMQIVESCRGLPLALVLIAGVLAKKAWSEKLWVEIAYKTSSYIVGEDSGCLETLGLSYNHLPLRLRECFLYLGGFPEDYEFEVPRLIWLWVAEGFIQQDGNKSLEDIAEGYLMDLVDRNLVIVARRSTSSGAIKACKMHDHVRELCLKKAREERFILQTKWSTLSSKVITPPYNPVRKFITTEDPNLSHLSTQNLRSVLLFRYFSLWSDNIAKYFRSFVLLRVLDLQTCRISVFPYNMELLVHLRFLTIWKVSTGFPSSICKLWNLQTLIYKSRDTSVVLPSNISDLVNLRHFKCSKWRVDIGSIEKPLNLQTVSCVRFKDEACSFQKYFPYIKKLSCVTKSDTQNDFKSLTYLERLNLKSYLKHRKNNITFPTTLKRLTLSRCCLPWSDMPIIQSLPNLQVLKLKTNAFWGSCWNTDGQEFPQLKFLRLEELNIQQLEVCSPSFPCLKQLEIIGCFNLEEVPLEIGDIPTLELIRIIKCWHSENESVRRIQQEQQDMGNYDLKIEVNYV